MTVTGAQLNRHGSKQDYGTPKGFLAAIQRRFGTIDWDLAAHADNAVCTRYLGPGSHLSDDALVVDWGKVLGHKSLGWLNPPFNDIAPWAERCARLRERPAWTLLLVPASVGTVWFADHVEGKAMIYWLAPRITFVGCEQGYPRDLMLAAYGFGARGSTCWDWR